MNVVRSHRSAGRHTYMVELSSSEQKWCDYRIITSVDRRRSLSEDEWEKIQSGERHPGHFGGKVTKTLTPNLYEVVVYVD